MRSLLDLRLRLGVALAVMIAPGLVGCTGVLSIVEPEDGTPLADAGRGLDASAYDGGPAGDGGVVTPGRDAGTSDAGTVDPPPRSDAGGPTDAGGGGADGGPSCTPSCGVRVCGGDGCGGSCGTCGSGTTCDAGRCVSAGPVCGDGVVEGDERCDGDCPTSCPNTTCTTRTLVGSAASCDARCESTPITACTSGDGCCPSGCTLPGDSDCALDCTVLSSWPADWAAAEQDALDEMNRHRSTGYDCASGPMMSVPPLTMSAAARISARCHSQDMAENNFFSHTGSDGSSFSQRMRDAGYTGTPRGENIAAGRSSGAGTTAQWMGSTTGHCEAVMSSGSTEVGIGYYRLSGTRYTHYWTANFGR